MDKNTVLVRGARQLLTLRGPSGPRRGPALQDLAVIPDGALLIRNGRIEDVGPTRRIENLRAARDAHVINAAGRIVMPAFVDSHAQIVFAHSGTRPHHLADAGRGSIQAGPLAIHAASGRWLRRHALALAEGMLRHGTCSIEAKSGYGLDDLGLLKTLRVHAAINGKPVDVVSTFLGPGTLPGEHPDYPDVYFDRLFSQTLPTILHRKLARFVDIRCEDGVFNRAQVKRFLEGSSRLGFHAKMQTGDGSGEGCVDLAAELKIVAISCFRHITLQETAVLARSSTIATLLPGSVFQNGGEPDKSARRLIEEGGIVALASNSNPDTNPGYNMQSAIALSCRNMGMTPAQAISAATINGAFALGSAARTGSLEPGKNANLLLMNVSDYRDIPYSAGVNNVHITVKDGAVVYTEGGVATLAS
ncbi:MAG: amidohydrolase family protein [Acidobacteriota bacterium]|nr:amidohydrolase family protein [Acidobacteriota bacterium]